MKSTAYLVALVSALATCTLATAAISTPERTTTSPAAQTIGIYDSRVVAYAWFWSEQGIRQRETLIAAARSACTDGDAESIARTEAAVQAFQDSSHLQVFSTAPIDEILDELQPKLPEILVRAGVGRLVSKWDEPALREAANAARTDVTDLLVAALMTPTEEQARIIADIRQHAPLPLNRAGKELCEGRL